MRGIGPVVEFGGKRLQICDKEVRVEVNALLQEGRRLIVYLHSPFQFEHPFWYGDYFQEVRIALNGDFLTEYRMEDGENRIVIQASPAFRSR